jgi:hypothetical protein
MSGTETVAPLEKRETANELRSGDVVFRTPKGLAYFLLVVFR